MILMDFKLPSPLANKSFRSVMTGLADLDLLYQHKLDHGLGLGVGFNYFYFDVNSNAFQFNVVGKMEGFNPYIKLAKRNKLGENAFFEYSINSGYLKVFSSSNQGPGSYAQEGYNVRPQLGIYLKSGDLVSFGLIASYNYMNFEFTPDNLSLDNFPGNTAENSVGNTQFFSVGFGFSTYIPDKAEN